MHKGRKHHSRRKSHRSRRHRGGASDELSTASPSSYSSAATWGQAINGSADAQYGRVFNQSSQFPPNGNAIIGAQGQRAGSRHRRRTRRHRTHRKKYRGGFMGMIDTALAPLALLGLQQAYSRKHKK